MNRKVTSNRKKYYAVTGETYKDLLIKSANKKGKLCRQYYLKVEELSIFLKEYMYQLNDYNKSKLIVDKINTNISIKNALIQLNYKEPNTEEIAKYVGFNDTEINMLKLFWDTIKYQHFIEII